MPRSNRKILFHIGWPKTGSTTLQSNAFPLLRNVRFLGKIPLSGSRNKPFFSFVYLLAYATEDWFNHHHHALWELLLQVERKKYDNNDESVALLLSDEGVLGTLFKPINHDHHGISVASIKQIASRLAELERLWNVDFQLLVVERDPIAFLHSYYAQLYYYFKRYRHLDTFEKYVDVGTSNDIQNDLGFANLKQGSVITELQKHFPKEKIHHIVMEDLFDGGRVYLHQWHPLLEEITVPIKKENVRSVGDGTKIANVGRNRNALYYVYIAVWQSLARYFSFLIHKPGSKRMEKEVTLTESIKNKLDAYLHRSLHEGGGGLRGT